MPIKYTEIDDDKAEFIVSGMVCLIIIEQGSNPDSVSFRIVMPGMEHDDEVPYHLQIAGALANRLTDHEWVKEQIIDYMKNNINRTRNPHTN